jgi:DNA primase
VKTTAGSTHPRYADRADHKAEVLAATNIVELIGQSVALKRRGRNYVGLCPFHQEKTPSFSVNPSRQAFYCFGCKAGGNAIDFVMKRDRVEFIDALRALGQAAGIEMPARLGGASKEKQGERQAMLDAHSAAVAFFENFLNDPDGGRAAREYLQTRGFTAETIKRFHIGLAVDAWDALLRSPVARKYTPPLLAGAGLLKMREGPAGGFYDTFRNRLMFPIRDETGRTVAFGGRVMPGSEDPAKYLNSPETPLFSKSRIVFGLDMARQKIVESRTVAVVEGYTDVIMAHQFGVSNVVSILGTGMTEQHVRLLRRFLPDEGGRIVLLFDADAAGSNAADRTVELFLTQPVEMAIATLPEGMDPDEYLLQHGAEAFERVLGSASNVLSYKWKGLFRRFASSPDDLTGQQKAVQQYLELLAKARGSGPVDPLRWGMALAQVSKLTGVPIDELNARFKVRRQVAGRPSATPPATQAKGPVQVTGPSEPTVTARGGADPNETLTPIVPARERAERQILGILLGEPHLWHDVQVQVHPEDFLNPQHRRIAGVYWSQQRDEGEPVFNQFLDLLDDPRLTELAVELVEDVESRVFTDTQDATEEQRQTALVQMLDEMVAYLAQSKRDQEQQKLLATLRRKSEEQQLQETSAKQDPNVLFEALVKNNQSTNLRRLGPMKRAR